MGVKLRERPGKGWYVLTDWRGQRKAKCFGKNKALAKEFKEKLEAKLKLGSAGIPCKAGVTFEEYAETWLEGFSTPAHIPRMRTIRSCMRGDCSPCFEEWTSKM
jgi:hypothetical protein